jgi:hypothetical protein
MMMLIIEGDNKDASIAVTGHFDDLIVIFGWVPEPGAGSTG